MMLRDVLNLTPRDVQNIHSLHFYSFVYQISVI